MAWNRNEARERIRKSYKALSDLTLEPLSREMDLRNLARTECRVVTGVHLYLEPINLLSLLKSARENSAELKRLLRHVHVYQRQLSWLLDEVDGGQRVHFQGGRLHAVFYKPYDTTDVSAPDLDRLAAAVQFVSRARELCQVIAKHTGILFELEAGLECGDAIATVNGEVNACELLFIGKPANAAAKILTGTLGDRYGEVAAGLVDRVPAPEALPARYDRQVEDDVADNPVSRIETFEPREAIDYEALGARTADLKEGTTFFGDIAGFTAHVASLSTDEEKLEALRAFHSARSEMHHVLRDYDGDFIQYQGDRIQGLFYEAGSTTRFAAKSIEAAAALEAAFGICREELPGFEKLGMTVGVAVGRVFVTRVGINGDREKIVLGRSVPRASQLQDESKPGWTAINERLHGLLNEGTQKMFTAAGDDRYEAELNLEVFVAREEAKLFENRLRVEKSSHGSFRVQEAGQGGIRPAKSYLSLDEK